MKVLSKQQVEDALLGAAIVGTGGGGSLDEGLRIVRKAFDEGLTFTLASPEEIDDSAMVGCPYGCGSISPFTAEQQAAYDAMQKIDTTPETAAVKVAEKFFGETFYGVIPTELGGANLAVCMDAGARLNKPTIDADPAGRSVPCLQQTTFYLKDIPIFPIAVASHFGDEMVIPYALSDERAEALVRAAAVASFNHVGVLDHPGKWEVMKDALHLNTVSMCIDIGKTAREARVAGRTIAYDIVEKFDGYLMFEGEISAEKWEDKDGFTFGDIVIDGTGKYDGDTLKVWYQNENLMSWLNGETFVMGPDPINIVNVDDNMPLLNPDAKVGMKVVVFGFKAFPQWRTEKGLSILGPKFFGFDTEYRKIEDLIK